MNNKNESQNNQFNRYLPDENRLDRDKLSIEVPAEQHPLEYDRVPSGYDPMGEIQLRGRVFRGLAGGQTSWWVIISGWLIFGFIAALVLHAAIATSSWAMGLLLAIALIPLIVLARGTAAKLSAGRRRV
jgi:hypothetical protein